MARRRRKATNSISYPEALPPCAGPRLHSFRYRDSPIEWLERLDGGQGDTSGSGTEGCVFKVRIESQLYALKIFKFFDAEDTRYYWGPLLGESFPVETVAFHTDPFFAECRAYGRIQEARERGSLKRQIAIRCEGFLLLPDEVRRMLLERGIDLDDLDDDMDEGEASSKGFVGHDRPRRGKGSRPVRAIVKELAPPDSGVEAKKLRTILRDIRQLNRLKIYNRDIRKVNFRAGKLVDFGSSWTEPHCFLGAAHEDEAAETRLEDLVMFDDMVAMEALATEVRGMPDWEYCSKLRPRKRKGGTQV